MPPDDASCSFCRKHYREVGPLVEGEDGAYICGECVELCQTILRDEKRRRAAGGDSPPAPDDLFELARRYLEAIQGGVTGEALAAFFAPDVVQVEYHNRL